MSMLLEISAPEQLAALRPVELSPLDVTDEELMARIQREDSAALGLLHDRYAGLLKGLVMKILHNDSEADDMLQEIFVEYWTKAGTYSEEKGRPLGWMVTLARRRAIDRLRKCDARNRAGDRLAEETRQQPQDWIAHVEEDLAHSEMRAHLNRVLDTLPSLQREAIELAFYKGMSQREIAAFTGIPLGTIKTRIELGLKKLSIALEGFEDLI